MKTILFRLLAFVAMLSTISGLCAQVRIGGEDAPAPGAILDLNSTDKGGLLLSNVELTDLTKIPVGFPGIDASNADTDDVRRRLIGAIVYNTNCAFDIGLYLWNGKEWKYIAVTDEKVVAAGSFSNESNVGGSVIDMLNQKATQSSLTVELKGTNEGNEETVKLGTGDFPTGNAMSAGLVLKHECKATDNCPSNVIIDGGGRVINLSNEEHGSLLTVGSGVTLTLKNITFVGHDENTASLIKVAGGGHLIIEDGVVIKNNKAGDTSGGGVSVTERSTFTMKGGEISGNYAGFYGGGMEAYESTFIMEGGIIKDNSSSSNGGGVNLSNGSFTMKGGTISGNTAGENGGGVSLNPEGYGDDDTFIMEGGTISGNTASSSNGGGVWIGKSENAPNTFQKTGGIIYGSNENGNSNTASGNGHAVYYCINDNSCYYRNNTLNTGDNIRTDDTNTNWTSQ
jgi:hypothetical protein